MKNFKRHKRLIIRGILSVLLVWSVVAGLIFLDIQKKQKIFQKEVQECYEKTKNEVVQLEKKEKEWGLSFAEAKKQIKNADSYQKLGQLREQQVESFLRQKQQQKFQNERIIWISLLVISLLNIGGLLINLGKRRESKKNFKTEIA